MKILLFGASGSGTTTLGSSVETRTGFKHLDADDYYWKKTNPPYQEKIALDERNRNLKADFEKFEDVIVSGSLVTWGKEWETAFDIAFFIRLENIERMERLKKRESELYGEKLLTDSKIQKKFMAFLEWANQYENPNFKGRSLKVHNNWIKALNYPVITLNGQMKITDKVSIILKEISNITNRIDLP